ncbi:MAG: DUF1775 domain-containing protein [Actinomycetes bacterium]
MDSSARVARSRFMALALVAGVGLVGAASAAAHPRVSPSVALARSSEVFSLAVPTEKEGVVTTIVELTVPAGFAIDSFVPAAGWTREVAASGAGESAVVQKVTWTAAPDAATPTGEDALFQFLAEPSAAKTYTFGVEQTTSDGSVVEWTGAPSADDPAPTVEVRSSLGGSSGSSTLALTALALAALGAVLAVIALLGGGGGRELA